MKRTRRVTGRGAIALLAACAAFGQSKEARPTYEAATAKINTSGVNGSSSHGSRGQVIMINMTLKRLVERAYGVKPFQVVGPDWMEGVHVDITAKYPEEAKPDDRIVMLRTLLEDRFKLVTHKESREVAGYGLVAAKGGIKLKPVAAGEPDTWRNSDDKLTTLKVQKASMAVVADMLARSLDETVVDKSGIAGVYDFEIHWAKEDLGVKANDVDAKHTLLLAIQDAIAPLGLRLHAEKVPVEMVMVDHLEKAPVEN